MNKLRNWREALISVNDTARDSVRAIDTTHIGSGLVVDNQQVLKGTVTDGDVRRGILQGYDMGSPVI